MKYIHPRRSYRNLQRWINNNVFLLNCRIHHVKCVIGKGSTVYRCSVCSIVDGEIIIGTNCFLKYCTFKYFGEGGKIVIGNYVVFNARPEAKSTFCVKNKSVITVDDECLFSNSIDVSTTDWHDVIDEQGNRLNAEKDIFIGKHVWIGRKVTVCKGVTINSNSIVAACSVVTKPVTESNVVVAGNPAVIKKRGVNWRG